MRASRRVPLLTLISTTTCWVGVSWGQADLEKAQLRNELGITYVKDGHLEDGLRSFTLLLAEYPENPAALNNVGNVYFLQGELQRARELYDRALAAKPDEGGIHLNQGILLDALGEKEASASQVRRGLELVGDLQEAYYLLGLVAQPPDKKPGAKGNALTGAAVEELLARASAEIPKSVKAESLTAAGRDAQMHVSERSADERRVGPGSSGLAARRTSTRPGGAKAAQPGERIDSNRLFWMKQVRNP